MVMLYALVAVCALSGALVEGSYVMNSTIKTQENFDFSKLVGSHWHLGLVEEGAETVVVKCVELSFQLDEKNRKILVFSALDPYIESRRRKEESHVVGSSDSAKLGTSILTDRALWVVGTDYQTYVVVYRSYEDHATSYDYAFVLFKNKKLDEKTVSTASKIAKEQGFDKKFVPAKCPK